MTELVEFFRTLFWKVSKYLDLMNHTDKKNLMLVRTRFQLLEAFHIRQKMLKNEHVDLILLSDQFDECYKMRLRKFFDNVEFVGNVSIKSKERMFFYYFPRRALKKLGVEHPGSYTDVFFYNPGDMFYYLKKYETCRKKHINWHILQDAQSNYVISDEHSYGCYNGYGNGLLNRLMKVLDQKVFGISLKKGFDEYLWRPELKTVQMEHEIVSVPLIDTSDKNYVKELNEIFSYDEKELDADIVFLDTRKGYYDDKYISKVIKDIIENSARKKIALYAHPCQDISCYEEFANYLDVKRSNSLWELVCINGSLRGKTVCGCYTSALILPFIISEFDAAEVFSFGKAMKPENAMLAGVDAVIEESNILYAAVASISPHFHFLSSVEEAKSFFGGHE